MDKREGAMLEVRLEGLTLRVELIVLDFCDMYARARVMGFYIILRARRLNRGTPLFAVREPDAHVL
jgi:hypothetical protein